MSILTPTIFPITNKDLPARLDFISMWFKFTGWYLASHFPISGASLSVDVSISWLEKKIIAVKIIGKCLF